MPRTYPFICAECSDTEDIIARTPTQAWKKLRLMGWDYLFATNRWHCHACAQKYLAAEAVVTFEEPCGFDNFHTTHDLSFDALESGVVLVTAEMHGAKFSWRLDASQKLELIQYLISSLPYDGGIGAIQDAELHALRN